MRRGSENYKSKRWLPLRNGVAYIINYYTLHYMLYYIRVLILIIWYQPLMSSHPTAISPSRVRNEVSFLFEREYRFSYIHAAKIQVYDQCLKDLTDNELHTNSSILRCHAFVHSVCVCIYERKLRICTCSFNVNKCMIMKGKLLMMVVSISKK